MITLHPLPLDYARRWTGWWKVLGLVLLIAPATVGCGTTASTPANATGPVDVQITLSVNKLASSLTTFTVGVPYHFIVTNKDAVEHEFMIMPPVAPQTTSAEIDKLTLVHIEESGLPANTKQTADYTFTKAYVAGTLEFACHLPGHYEAGMRLPIVVK